MLNNDKIIDVDKFKLLYTLCNAMHFCQSVFDFCLGGGEVIYLSKILVTKKGMTYDKIVRVLMMVTFWQQLK